MVGQDVFPDADPGLCYRLGGVKLKLKKERNRPKESGWYWVEYYHQDFGHLLEPMYYCEDSHFEGRDGVYKIEDKRLHRYSLDQIDWPDGLNMEII